MQSAVCVKPRRERLTCRELAYIERRMGDHKRGRDSGFMSVKLHIAQEEPGAQ